MNFGDQDRLYWHINREASKFYNGSDYSKQSDRYIQNYNCVEVELDFRIESNIKLRSRKTFIQR
jgi:outer membrane receptor for ferrienterochelin and colicin